MKTFKSRHSLRFVFLSLLLGLGLVACAVGPDFKTPPAPKATSFTREPNILESGSNASMAIDSQWWLAYGSSELNRLVELALEHNPNIDVAIANLTIAKQNVIAQQGFFFPQVGAGYVASRQNVGATLAPAINTTNSVYNLQTAQLTVGFTPDIFGGNRRQVESLMAAASAQQYQLDALRITMATNVIATAVQEAVLREQIKLAQASVEASRAQLAHTRLMAQKGYLSDLDMANQEAAYAQAIAQIPALRKYREQALDLLSVLCGKLPSEQLLLPNLDSIHIPDRLPASIPSNLVGQRPDVKIAEEFVRASNAQIGVAISNMIPQFSIVGIVGGSAEVFSQLFNGSNNIWGIAAGVGQPIFAGGTLLARKRAAEAGLDASVAQYRSTVLTAFQNVADTLYAIENDGQIYQAARAGTNSYQKVFQKSELQFQNGYAPEPAVLMAKQQYLQSKINEIQAFSTYLGDTAALYQSLGGGWTASNRNQ